MKIAIIGPGAIGILFGLNLIKAKEEVVFLDNNTKRAGRLKKDGIKIDGISGAHRSSINITTDPKEIGVSDLVVVCVKSYDTEDAIKHAMPLLGDRTRVLTLQNGAGNVQILEDAVGDNKVIGGITSQGANVKEWGHVVHAGRGDTIIGMTNKKVLGPIRDVARILNKAGFQTKVSKDINSIMWSKLIINVGINALTALTRLNNGRLLDFDGTKDVMRRAVSEAVKVAKRKRVRLTYDDPIQKVELVCKATSKNISSMLQDVLRKKKTEIEFINGAIVRQGANYGIPTPVNSLLTNLVKTIETSYDKQVV
ncbi:MAG: 2-dehydropantoate 2-reductase [Candidatus Omnitrophica bacterium]|nr:2-dehydropantoate 2-reductase [Candidatus Omnitrophota bacterium]